ncbi:hypothetical protein N507_1711 [Lacticaseibacillus rhamnosus DSM 14870]|nr:hypothetical protein N507_1711 [Lacticaseibacillus rhamnosus DSM 14870]
MKVYLNVANSAIIVKVSPEMTFNGHFTTFICQLLTNADNHSYHLAGVFDAERGR